MKFTNIPDRLMYNANLKAKLSALHTQIVDYAIANYKSTSKFKHAVIDLMNRVSVAVTYGDTVSLDINSPDFLDSIPIESSVNVSRLLGGAYIEYDSVSWDIESVIDDVQGDSANNIAKKLVEIHDSKRSASNIEPTPKENLYIKAPTVPQFDMDSVWLSFYCPEDNDIYTIYNTLPLIPTMQREISITTDVNRMSSTDLLNLFPNRFIPTRSPVMYTPMSDMAFDGKLGVIFPIDEFTEEQVKDNIIKYPHLYQLDRWIGEDCVSFYSNIEIDGKLYDTLEVWDSLPESKIIPKTSEFIKEYVARRYLLERDIKGIKHKYPLRGDLNPYLTLFTTTADYASFGYDDSIALAKLCVKSRVNYWLTRNPIVAKYKALRSVGGEVES